MMVYPIHIFKNDFCYEIENEKSLEEFSKLYHLLDAAGGIVENEKKEILMISRFGKWDFPKGKVESGETLEQAALREISEETGLKQLELITELPPTFHLYDLRENHILKRTFWFKMRSMKPEILIPQTEEGIEIVQWVPQKEVAKLLENSYPSLKKLWNVAVEK